MMKKSVAKRSRWRLSAAALAIGVTVTAARAAGTGKTSPTNASAPHALAANVPFLVHGKKVELRSFIGQPIMVWQVTTWCPSCRAGLATMAQHKSLIDASNVKIIVLRDYKNGGYPGQNMEKFVAEAAPTLRHDQHFVFGEDTKTLFKLYNPHHFIDIYQLIEAGGRVALVSSAPSATFGKIERFIRAAAKS